MKQLLIAIDQLINTLVYAEDDGFGYSDETLSARAFRLYLQDKSFYLNYKLIDTLFFFQPNHCFKSWRAEFDRKQLPNYYRISK